MNTFLLVVFATVFSTYNNYFRLPEALFFLCFGSMQLIEYFLWKFPNLNETFSKAGFALIASQPFFSINLLNKKEQLQPLLGTYAAFLLYSLYIFMNPKKFDISFISKVAPNGHLHWDWLPTDPIFTGLYLILLLIPLYLGGITLGLSATILTLLISLYTYGKDNTWASMWCWLAALISFGAIGMSIHKAGTC